MVVPFQRIMQYVKKNQKPSIITPQPNDAILAADDEVESENILENSIENNTTEEKLEKTANKIVKDSKAKKNNNTTVRKKAKISTIDEIKSAENRSDIISKLLDFNKQDTNDFIKDFNFENYNLSSLSLQNIPKTINYAFDRMMKISPIISKKILEYDTKGIGAGELLLKFIFDDVQIAGGSTSYDIIAGSSKFEVKSYAKTGDIRLGTESTVTRFPIYSLMFAIYDCIARITKFSSNEMEALLKMLSNVLPNEEYTREILVKQIQTKKETDEFKENPKEASPIIQYETLSECLRKGEVGNENLHSLDKPLRYFGKIVTAIYSNKFDYMKLINKDLIYPVLEMDESNKDNPTVKLGAPLKKEDETNVINTLHELFLLFKKAKLIDGSGNFDYERSFKDEMLNDINQTLTGFFKKHPMIIINSKTDKNPCIGVFTEVEVQRASQGGFRVNALR